MNIHGLSRYKYILYHIPYHIIILTLSIIYRNDEYTVKQLIIEDNPFGKIGDLKKSPKLAFIK